VSAYAWKDLRTIYRHLTIIVHYLISSSEYNLHEDSSLEIYLADMRFNNEMKSSVLCNNFKCATSHINTSSSYFNFNFIILYISLKMKLTEALSSI
jgi:hypothetical protein